MLQTRGSLSDWSLRLSLGVVLSVMLALALSVDLGFKSTTLALIASRHGNGFIRLILSQSWYVVVLGVCFCILKPEVYRGQTFVSLTFLVFMCIDCRNHIFFLIQKGSQAYNEDQIDSTAGCLLHTWTQDGKY